MNLYVRIKYKVVLLFFLVQAWPVIKTKIKHLTPTLPSHLLPTLTLHTIFSDISEDGDHLPQSLRQVVEAGGVVGLLCSVSLPQQVSSEVRLTWRQH